MSFSLNGKTAIVSGAASGLGLAIAHHFTECGANVVYADADEERLSAALGVQARADSGPVRAIAGDLRQKLAIANLISATLDAFERIDILVNAAAEVRPCDPLGAEGDGVEDLWTANALTTLRVSQQVARRMIAQAEGAAERPAEAGSIINLSLARGRSRPDLLGAAIAASAVDQITRSLALALAPHRVRVNAIAVGSVMTSGLHAALKEHPEIRDEILALTPMGRIAGPREVAATAQFLASDAAGFMTGQVLTVDGGRSLLETPAGAIG